MFKKRLRDEPLPEIRHTRDLILNLNLIMFELNLVSNLNKH